MKRCNQSVDYLRSGKTLVLLVIALFSAAANANACSYSKVPTIEDTFKSSVAVFRGTITHAEVLKATKSETDAYYHVIKVYWKIDEVYKGKGLAGKSAITTDIGCGSVTVVVGQQYVFAIWPFGSDEKADARLKDAIGTLDNFGTGSAYFSQSTFEQLRRDFKKLSKRN
jgi:hypothetical protein